MNNNSVIAHIVIGLGYGDEGKGLTVDHLCETVDNPVVVRFSGGQQAGHTVHFRDQKHTFSNVGAGAFRNVPTYFTEHTTMYPLTLLNELKVLKGKGIQAPKIVYHPMVRITTPWDIFMNRTDSENLAHGTCGLGIGKTMERSEGMYQLRMCDTLDSNVFMHKLEAIRKEYTRFIPEAHLADLEGEIENFVKAFESVAWHISNYEYLNNFKNIVFEGSQGVMLDMDHGVFPNVTYSNTTSKNAMGVCDKLFISARHLWGVTRAYSTRHGKGNGEYTGEHISLKHTEHETNVNNVYQGEFLVSKIDYNRLAYACLIEDIYSEGKVVNHLMVTCCNQVDSDDDFDFHRVNFKFDHVYHCYDTHHKELFQVL